MKTCNIKGCNGRKSRDSNLTFHRIPMKNKKQWLEAIGEENINFNTRHTYICSLHFDESCFNPHTNIIKLHNDAIPCQKLPTQKASAKLDTQSQLPTAVNEDMDEVKISVISEDPRYIKITHFKESRLSPSEPLAPDIQPSIKKDLQIRLLKEKCKKQKMKIRSLDLSARRHKSRIETFLNIVQKLKEKNVSKYTDHTYM